MNYCTDLRARPGCVCRVPAGAVEAGEGGDVDALEAGRGRVRPRPSGHHLTHVIKYSWGYSWECAPGT